MMRNGEDFAGRTAVVTGAASGIGRATSEALLRRGSQVIGLDIDRDKSLGDITWVPCDVSDPVSVESAFAQVAALAPHLELLVNNAGIGAIGTVEQATEADWASVFGVNVFGVARVSRHAIPLLRRAETPAIVNVSSIAALVGTPVRAVYSATKGAVDALTRSMASDYVGDGIRVNVVYPGTVETSFTGRLDKDPTAAKQLLIERQPMKRLIGADEIADAILYLGSPHNPMLTGSGLRLDGGMTTLVNLGTA